MSTQKCRAARSHSVEDTSFVQDKELAIDGQALAAAMVLHAVICSPCVQPSLRAKREGMRGLVEKGSGCGCGLTGCCSLTLKGYRWLEMGPQMAQATITWLC